MIKNIAELKQLIQWAKDNKVKSINLGDIKFELSDFAYIEGAELTDEQIASGLSEYNTDTLTDTLKDEENEDLLFWSSNK